MKPRSGTIRRGSKLPVSLQDFHAYMPMHQYIFAPSREIWPAISVDRRIPPQPRLHADGSPILDEEGNPKTIKASAWLDKHRPVTWAPGEPEVRQGSRGNCDMLIPCSTL